MRAFCAPLRTSQPARWTPTVSRNRHYRQPIFSMGWSWPPRCPVPDPTSRGSTDHATSAGKDRWRAKSTSAHRARSARLTADSAPLSNGRRRREGQMLLPAMARGTEYQVSSADHGCIPERDADLKSCRSFYSAVRCLSGPIKPRIYCAVQR